MKALHVSLVSLASALTLSVALANDPATMAPGADASAPAAATPGAETPKMDAGKEKKKGGKHKAADKKAKKKKDHAAKGMTETPAAAPGADAAKMPE